MRINEKSMIVGERCVLVPYREQHVPKYHAWMQNEELLEATCSERLSLAEEYEMQKSWQVDDNKLTFIILDLEMYDKTNNEVESMVGDVNGFIIPSEFDSENEGSKRRKRKCVELSVMIAEVGFRKRGLATEAVALMMLYMRTKLGLRDFVAKIHENNETSILLFERLHFHRLDYSEAFNCLTMGFEPKCFTSLANKFKLQISPLKENPDETT